MPQGQCGVGRDRKAARTGGDALLEPNVLQILLQAILMIHGAVWRALGGIGAVQRVELLRLRIAGLAAQVAEPLHPMQPCFAHRYSHAGPASEIRTQSAMHAARNLKHDHIWQPLRM